jgi:hypothetical protein
MTQTKCKRCEFINQVIADANKAFSEGLLKDYMHQLTELLARSGMDLCPCRLCGHPVICIPDGLPLCKDCAERVGA